MTHVNLSQEMNYPTILRLMETANQFQSYILIERNQERVNAKSLLGLSTLNGFQGEVVLHAVGRDSFVALNELQAILKQTKIEQSH